MVNHVFGAQLVSFYFFLLDLFEQTLKHIQPTSKFVLTDFISLVCYFSYRHKCHLEITEYVLTCTDFTTKCQCRSEIAVCFLFDGFPSFFSVLTPCIPPRTQICMYGMEGLLVKWGSLARLYTHLTDYITVHMHGKGLYCGQHM